MKVAMIAAGGVGSRFGADIPKQYVPVLGKPLIVYTLENFQDSPDIDAIEVACTQEYQEYVRELAAQYGITKLKWVVDSGKTAQDTLRSGVYGLRPYLADEDIVMIHPAVMPFLSRKAIADCLRVCEEKGCSFTMFPVRPCLARRGDNDSTSEYVYKEEFVEINCPWAFYFGDVYNLYREAEKLHKGEDFRAYTFNLWIDMGHEAHYYRGDDASNLKITTPFDLELMELYLTMKQKKEGADA